MTEQLQYANGKFVRQEPKDPFQLERERNAELVLEMATLKAERDQWRAVAEMRGRLLRSGPHTAREHHEVTLLKLYGDGGSAGVKPGKVSIKTKMYR